MVEAVLTNFELKFIEHEIDRINSCTELLNPRNNDDAEALCYYDSLLNEYINVLKKSYKKAKIKQSGFRIID